MNSLPRDPRLALADTDKRKRVLQNDEVSQSAIALPKKGKAGTTRSPVTLRLCNNVDEWTKFLARVSESKTLENSDERAVQALTGLTFSDLRFELQLLRDLQRKLEDNAMNNRGLKQLDCNFLKTMQAFEGPRYLVLQGLGPETSADYQIVNATEVVNSFAIIASGDEDESTRRNNRGGICLRPFYGPDREMHLSKWFKQKNVRYILNLAGDEPCMQNISYPVEKSKVEKVHPDTSAEGSPYDIPEDGDDDKIRIMSLPMVDVVEPPNNLVIATSWELREAAKFVERAWRRYKRLLFESCKRKLLDDDTETEEKLPMIIIHCIGGINRSPLAVIYWMLTYHALITSPDTSSYYLDEVWNAVCKKRWSAFDPEAKGECPVLNKKEMWREELRKRVELEKACFKPNQLPTLYLPIILSKFRKEIFDEAMREKRSLMCARAHCGGMAGSPVLSDEEEWI